MFKRGKYEATPTEAAAKYAKTRTKSNLLSAYFTSLLCMILCAAMFLSTSMAWFTSEVQNSGNQIYVGTLGVKLYNGAREITNGSEPILDDVMLSPDKSEVVALTVENTGNLPFNYRLSMTIDHSGLEEGPDKEAQIAKAMKAAGFITVWVKSVNEGEVATFNAATAAQDGWNKVGENLVEVLAGKVVLSGAVNNVSTADENQTPERHSYAVALHMDPNAPSEIMGAKLTGISVKLVAAQQVDGLSVVADEQELRDAVARGGNILLLNDIDVDADETMTVASGKTVSLYMNGHVIAGVSGEIGSNRNLFDVRGTLNVYDGTVTVHHVGEDMVWSSSTNVIHIEGGGVVNLKNATIMNLGGSSMAIGIHMNNWGEVTLNANNSKIVGTYCGVRVFNSGNHMNNVNITNSTLTGKLAFWVHNYTVEDFGDQAKADAAAARINSNLLIANPVAGAADASNLNPEANNTVHGRILYGFTNGPEYYTDGVIPAAATDAASLQTAVNNGGYIVLAQDVDLGNASINIPTGANVTLDLAGNDLSGKHAGGDHYAMFNIPTGAALTIEGDGNVTANTTFAENNRSGAIFQNSGKLTINGGNYTLKDGTVDKTWIIATIIDNRTKSASDDAVVTINGGEFSVAGKAKNLFRNYPQQGGAATIIFNDGIFHANPDAAKTYIWNQEAGDYPGTLYFNGGIYENGVVFEDYNGQADIIIAPGVNITPYDQNN